MNAVILVSGKISSGKNTLAEMIKAELEAMGVNVAVDSFAKPLKDMCKEAFKPLTEYLNDLIRNQSPWGFDHLITSDENWYENKNEITRRILQAVGTDVVRKVNPNYWAESFVQRCLAESSQIIINSDCRFPSEIEAVWGAYKMRCFKIRVERKTNRDSVVHEHSSETALDVWSEWDMMIENNGTLDELKNEAKEIAAWICKTYVKGA